jgi:hypothetical protein
MALTYTISPDSGASSSDRYTRGDATHRLVLDGTGAKRDIVEVSYVDPPTGNVRTLTTTGFISSQLSKRRRRAGS